MNSNCETKNLNKYNKVIIEKCGDDMISDWTSSSYTCVVITDVIYVADGRYLLISTRHSFFVQLKYRNFKYDFFANFGTNKLVNNIRIYFLYKNMNVLAASVAIMLSFVLSSVFS